MSRLEAYVVYLLHKRGAYDTRAEEEWYQQKEEKAVRRAELVDAINNLHGIKAVDFNNRNIYLKENVWSMVK